RACPGSVAVCAHSNRSDGHDPAGAQDAAKLTLQLDHSMGAGHHRAWYEISVRSQALYDNVNRTLFVSKRNAAAVRLKTCLSPTGLAIAFFFAGAGLGFAFDKAKLDTFLTTNACKYCDLTGADLSGRDMRGADLQNAQLGEANLSGADLSTLAMEKRTQPSNLESANLRGANLSNANLAKAAAARVYLREANLTGADLSGADLSHANLQDANLAKAMLDGTRLGGAKFCGTIMPDGSTNDSGCQPPSQ
ncbi:MAG: pentapeptide repeat-containing protein, partial [Alphaproteobacteria bacterium]|nr:pentapeptide repeat-containing protein [Alphaproteobacteria bacterium]